jgi:hypothetical protein
MHLLVPAGAAWVASVEATRSQVVRSRTSAAAHPVAYFDHGVDEGLDVNVAD